LPGLSCRPGSRGLFPRRQVGPASGLFRQGRRGARAWLTAGTVLGTAVELAGRRKATGESAGCGGLGEAMSASAGLAGRQMGTWTRELTFFFEGRVLTCPRSWMPSSACIPASSRGTEPALLRIDPPGRPRVGAAGVLTGPFRSRAITKVEFRSAARPSAGLDLGRGRRIVMLRANGPPGGCGH